MLKYLEQAGVPVDLHKDALKCLEEAKERSKGLLWHKTKVRWLKAGKLAKMIPWEAERLIDVRLDLASYDVAPVENVKILGDFFPWVQTAQGYKPSRGQWLNPDPESEEYKIAVASNKWTPNTHPRSYKSKKNAFRRNGGEYEAWSRGITLPKTLTKDDVQTYRGNGVVVHHSNGAWQIITRDKWLKIIPVKVRIGYEIDNVYNTTDGIQNWIALDGFDLRAPLSWSIIPG